MPVSPKRRFARNGTVLGFLLCAFAGTTYAQNSFLVVVHETNSIVSLSPKELSDIFLGKTKKWNDGTKVQLVDLSVDSSLRSSFSKTVHGRDVLAIRSYWQSLIFSGRGKPPLELDNDVDVLSYVYKNPSAVGYVSQEASIPAGLKTVRLVN